MTSTTAYAERVYNNFPWPQNLSDAREAHPDATLADLYDPLSMPLGRKRAHDKLDKAVDKCYRAKAFTSERERVEHLFKLYGELTQPLLPAANPARRRRSAD